MAVQTPFVPDENAEDIIDLTELIERGDAAAAGAPAQDLAAQPGGEDAEIEALLAQMDASDGATLSKGPAAPLDAPAPAAPGVVDPNEQLDMSDMGDIDNLLASLDIPPQPPHGGASAPQPAASQAAPAADTPDMPLDLDKAMDELLGGTAPQAPKGARTAQTPPTAAPSLSDQADPAAAASDMLQDLDQAMDELLATPAPQPAQAAPAAAAGAPSVEELLAAATMPAAPAAPAATAVPDLEADLDALLNDAALAAPPADAPAPGAPDLDSLLTSLDDAAPAPGAQAPETPAPDVAAIPEPPQPAPSAPEAAPDFAELLDAQTVAGPAMTAHEVELTVEAPLPETAPPVQASLTVEPELEIPAADEAELAAELPVVEDAAPGPEPEIPVPEEPAAMPEPEPAAVAPSPRGPEAIPEQEPAPATPEPEAAPGMTAETPEASATPEEPAAPGEAAAPVTAAALLAEAEDFAALAGALGERLRQCEADLAAARARIEALEHSAADSVSLGDLLREGSPLHTGFSALIASSVGQALKETPPPATMPEGLEGRLAGIETRQKSLLARMDAMEQRLDSLEPRFNEEVGKAAASAVARILREEISRLMEG